MQRTFVCMPNPYLLGTTPSREGGGAPRGVEVDVDGVCRRGGRVLERDLAVVDRTVLEGVQFSCSVAANEVALCLVTRSPNEDGEVPVPRRPDVLVQDHPLAHLGESSQVLPREVPPIPVGCVLGMSLTESIGRKPPQEPRLGALAAKEVKDAQGCEQIDEEADLPLFPLTAGSHPGCCHLCEDKDSISALVQ